jgi:hypothetical protein
LESLTFHSVKVNSFFGGIYLILKRVIPFCTAQPGKGCLAVLTVLHRDSEQVSLADLMVDGKEGLVIEMDINTEVRK